MENYEELSSDELNKLTPKEEKIILFPYVIHSINNAHKLYTTSQVLNFYNNVLVKHGFKKITPQSMQKYLVILKKLGIIHVFIKKIRGKSALVYYKLTKNTTECAEFLKNYFIKESLDKFIEARDNYFKSVGVL